jgi:carbamoyltransferase
MNPTNEVVLGIWDGHDAGAAVSVDGHLLSAVSEERITRLKKQAGFPAGSVRLVLELSGIAPQQVTRVALAGTTGRLPARLLARGYTARRPQQEDPLGAPARLYAAYQNTIAGWPGVRGVERAGSRLLVAAQLRALGIHAPLSLVDHHTCHALTAVAGLDPAKDADALVITMDGYGDQLCSAVWRWSPRLGQLERLAAQGADGSLALLYGGLSTVLGFAPGEEGKVTGLAAAAPSGMAIGPSGIELNALATVRDGRIQLDRRRALATLRTAVAAGVDRTEVAAMLQAVVERTVVGVAAFWLEKTAFSRLAVAGGLFANVSLNGCLAQLDLDEFAVFGAMGDAGLCAGAAFSVSLPRRPQCASLHLGPQPNLAAPGLPAAQGPARPEAVAQQLADGAVVAVCRGAMEFGPRALGGRSLLFDARSTATALQVGAALRRPAFMPFAPLVDVDRWPQLFDMPLARVRRCAAEMSIALPLINPASLPAAAAGDGTARPQALDATGDPWLRQVLQRFTALTGCPALVNTSLNNHREPIVMTAAEAAVAARTAGADLLVVADTALSLSGRATVTGA